MEFEPHDRQKIFNALCLFHFMNDAITFLIPTLLATFYMIFGLSWEQILLILAYNLLLTIIFQIINGWFTDKGYERPLYILGFFLLAFSTGGILFSKDYTTLLIFNTISGIALGFQHTLGYNMTAKLFVDPKVRSSKLAINGSWGDSGKMTAVFSTAIMFLFYPQKWEYIIILWVIIISIGFICSLIFIYPYKFNEIVKDNIRYSKKHLAGIVQIESDGDSEEVVGSFLKGGSARKRIAVLFALNILVSGIFELSAKPIAIYLADLGTGIISSFPEFWFGFFMIFSVMGARSSGTGVHKFGFTKYVQILMICYTINIILFSQFVGGHFILVAILLITLPLSLFPLYTLLLGEFSKVVAPQKIGKAYGFFIGIGWGGGFIFTRIAASWVNSIGIDANFILCLIIVVIITIINFVARKEFLDF